MVTIDGCNEDIKVEEIMSKIKENMKKRKERGEIKEMRIMSSDDSSTKKRYHIIKPEIQLDMEHINSNWNIQDSSYSLSSHRPVIGKALVTGRKLVHEEVRRYVDPMIGKQKDFNGSTVRILNEAIEKIEELYSCTKEIERCSNQFKNDILMQIDEEISRSQAKMSLRMDENQSTYQAKISSNIEGPTRTSMSATNENKEYNVNYLVFEERFRGSRADIKSRQSKFLKYFEGCKSILDIGCGRGEFLEILGEQGISGHGIDIDADMVNFCRSKDFDVELTDALSCLEGLKDRSVEGIFVDQVVEHLEPDYLTRMLGLCYRKLVYGGFIVVETVNPLSFFSFANFYIDMSHKKPVHPETLIFLFEATGFREIETLFLEVPPEEKRLIEMSLDQDADEKEERYAKTYNHNIGILNNILFGPQDYAVIGRR